MPRSTFGLSDITDDGLDKKSFKHIGKLATSALVNYVNKGGLRPHPMMLEPSSTRTNGHGRPCHGDDARSKSPSVVQRTDALLRGLLLILEHHDANEVVRGELVKQIHSYLDTSDSETVWLKRCKHLLCFPLAKFLRNPLPPSPDKVFKPSGILRSWFKARLNAYNRKNIHLWYSWFQAKRSTLPLSDEVVSATYEKHLETLTSHDPATHDVYRTLVLDEIFEDPIFRKVLGIIREAVWKRSYNDDPLTANPKTSACFEQTRLGGGQVEDLRDQCGLTDKSVRHNSIVSPEFDSMTFCPKIFTREGLKFNQTISRSTAYGYSEWQTLKDLKTPEGNLRCTIQAVLEPNKIRVISKGNSLPYYLCKSLQTTIHDIMREIPCFSLIGRPIMDSDISRLAALSKSNKDVWNSVDYSAATDGLSFSYSNRIFQNIVCNLEDEKISLASQVLGMHDLYYPPASGKGDPEFRGTQTNGQLMGSILSFPFLCLANLGIYLRATRSHRKKLGWSLEQTLNSVLINGDDMVYASPVRCYDKNVIYGKAVGLEMSVGKAYTHKSYLNINSQSFVCPLDTERKEVTRINFLNTGLFFGLHKVQGKKDDGRKMKVASEHSSKSEGIVANLNCLLSGSLPSKECQLLAKSLEFNRDSIYKECKGKTFRGDPHLRNLFIKESLGGMGVQPPVGWLYKVSKNDLYIASGFLGLYPSLEYSLEYPLPGPPPEDLPDFRDRPWCPRDTGSVEPVVLPKRQHTFKDLRRIVRSKVFSFFVPNKNHFIFNPKRINKKNSTCSLASPGRRPYDPGFEFFNEQLEKALMETPPVSPRS